MRVPAGSKSTQFDQQVLTVTYARAACILRVLFTNVPAVAACPQAIAKAKEVRAGRPKDSPLSLPMSSPPRSHAPQRTVRTPLRAASAS
eukprot:6185752-Pleurochrysis_carterae.AAC.1